MTDRPQSDRLRLLVDAGIALSSELSLDALLQRIVEAAAAAHRRALRGARRDRQVGRRARALPDHGHRRRDARRDRRPARGRGILGVLIRDAQTAATARHRGRPALGRIPAAPPADEHVPRRADRSCADVAYGNLYLTEKRGRRRLHGGGRGADPLLAAQAAVAIENARLYESSTRWLRQLESLNEIGNALAAEIELDPLLALVAAPAPGARRRPARAHRAARRRRRAAGRGGRRETATPASWSTRACDRAARRSGASSSAAGASASTPCSTIPRSTSRPLGASAFDRRSTSRSSSKARAIGVVVAHDKLGPRPALHRRRPAPRRVARSSAPPSPSTSPSASAATPCAASSRRRSSSARASRASCTTRPARR